MMSMMLCESREFIKWPKKVNELLLNKEMNKTELNR